MKNLLHCKRQQHQEAHCSRHLHVKSAFVVGVRTRIPITEHVSVCVPEAPQPPREHTSATGVALDLGWTSSWASHSRYLSMKRKFYKRFSGNFLTEKMPNEWFFVTYTHTHIYWSHLHIYIYIYRCDQLHNPAAHTTHRVINAAKLQLCVLKQNSTYVLLNVGTERFTWLMAWGVWFILIFTLCFTIHKTTTRVP